MSEDEVVYIEPVILVGDHGDCRECKRWPECKGQIFTVCEYAKSEVENEHI